MECQTVFKETQLQGINNPSELIHSSISKSLQQLHTTGMMEAKLLAALSLLLVVGQLSGEHNQNRILKYSFFPVPASGIYFEERK